MLYTYSRDYDHGNPHMRPISPLRSDARRGARAQQQCGPGIARRPRAAIASNSVPMAKYISPSADTKHCIAPARRAEQNVGFGHGRRLLCELSTRCSSGSHGRRVRRVREPYQRTAILKHATLQPAMPYAPTR